MIALLALAQTALVAPGFAPPVGLSIPYQTVSTRPARTGGTVRMTLDEQLRFDPADDGFRITATAGTAGVEAPAAVRPMLQALFTGSEGSRVQGHVAPDGHLTGIVDGAGSWAVVRAGQAAALARLVADPTISDADKQRARILNAGLVDVGPAARDARLADSLAALMAPALPALHPGETRRFSSTLDGPAGPVGSTGSVTLVGADDRRLDYRVNTRTDPTAAMRATDALLAAIEPGDAPAAKTRREAAAAAMRGLTYGETLEATVDRASGLLIRSHQVRWTEDERGRQVVVDDTVVTCQVDTVS